MVDLGGIYGNPIYDGNNDYGPKGSQGQMANEPLTATIAGQSFGQFWGLQTKGIYQKNDPRLATAPKSSSGYSPQAGDLIFVDRNHDGMITAQDDTTIGNPYPKFTYGFNVNVNWKGFDLVMLLHGVQGVDLFNGVAPYSEGLFSNGNTTSKVFGASNLGTNGVTSQPQLGSNGADLNGNYKYASSYFVENGSYLKLQNLQIGYTFSNKLLSKAKIRSARFFVMGNNLFTITKYTGLDPELGSQDRGTNAGVTSRGIDAPYKYPSVRSYSMGLDISF